MVLMLLMKSQWRGRNTRALLKGAHLMPVQVENDILFMTWKLAHADYLCKKVATRVSIIGRMRGFVTKEAAILAYNTMIDSLTL